MSFNPGDLVQVWSSNKRRYHNATIMKGPFNSPYTEQGMEGNFVDVPTYTVLDEDGKLYDLADFGIKILEEKNDEQ